MTGFLGVVPVTLLLAAAGPHAQSVYDEDADETDVVLAGQVVSPDGAPVAGARIELRTRLRAMSIERGRALSDADGRFSLRVEPLDAHGFRLESFLAIEGDGFAPSHLERVYEPPPSHDLGPIVLHPPVELRGRVTDVEGRPVAGAEIHGALGPVRGPHGDHADRPPLAVTGSDGGYACRTLPPGLVTLGASAEGRADRVLAPLELRADEVNSVDFVLEPERRVTLHVTSSSEAPLVGLRAEPLGERWDEAPYEPQAQHMAFWRGAQPGDELGRIALRGLDPAYRGEVRVVAEGQRVELAAVEEDRARLVLQPVLWIDFVAVGADLHELAVRDVTRPPSWCGNCDESRVAKLSGDSPAVRKLSARHWRVGWNGRGCLVDGGLPGAVNAVSTVGTLARAELPCEFEPGVPIECRLDFDEPARLSGTVRDPSGAPVAVRLGVRLSLYGDDWLATVSDAEGRFEFERIGAGASWLYALDERWEVDEDHDRVGLSAGVHTSGVTVLVRPRPEIGRARGLVRIAGAPPDRPLLLALDEVPNQHLPSAYPRGFAWTDQAGRFEIAARWPREYHVVPKRRPPEPSGGWRDFAAEFPAHDARWPWKVEVPESGTSETVIELPPESEWDRIATPRAQR